MLTRRSMLVATCAAAAVPATKNGAEKRASGTLAAAAARSGRWFGAAVRNEQLSANIPFRDALLRECSSFTPETEMKWAVLEPQRGVLNFTALDSLAATAAVHGKTVHGHALLWHKSIPGWAEDAFRDDRDWSLVSKLFASVIPRYGAMTRRWDVVNEPIAIGDRKDGLRPGSLLAAFGPSYIHRALDEARAFAPRAMLAINEYGLDYAMAEEQARRDALLRLVEGLRAKGAPLNLVGIQAHLDLTKGPFDERVFADFLDRLAATGVRIAITELDVKEADYIAPVVERDRLVADLAGRYLGVALANQAVLGVTTWGLSDAASWLEVTPTDLARFPGAWATGPGPGLNRGLPLDTEMRPKPLYNAIRQALLSRTTVAARAPSTLP